MEVIKYLKQNGLEALQQEFSIKVKEYPEGLFVLNYDQINSPKTHPIVVECRSLIIDTEFNVVSRSFDRFFNYGEAPETQTHIDMSKAYLHDKIDGSLIKIYRYKDVWHIATRGTAFAESDVNGFGITFKDLVMESLGFEEDEDFQYHCNNYLNKDLTYICEVTSMENRVVTRYDGTNLWYLAARDNSTGIYENGWSHLRELGAIIGSKRFFDSMDDCVAMAKELPNLEEGYVLYQNGYPVCKIKSPAYVAVHHLRGEGLNPKRIAQLVLTGEQEEYLEYFPEDREHIEPYVSALEELLYWIDYAFSKYKHIESQKEFAIYVKDYSFSSVLFKARKIYETRAVVSASGVFISMPDNYKLNLLLEEVK